jgi:hypothetical protein
MSCFVRTVIVLGVIACLCLSVGEGLRLRPFPVSILAAAVVTDAQPNKSVKHENSRRKYGPLDVPTRIITRSKRQASDYVKSSSQEDLQLAIHGLLFFGSSDLEGIVSDHVASIAQGRAPPLIM